MSHIAMPAHAAPQRPTLPGDQGVWMFICGELFMFGAFFIVYIAGRAQAIESFNRSQLELDQSMGAFNTVLLVTSSWCVARAVAAVRAGRDDQAARRLLAGMLLGLGFLVVKYLEYSAKFAAGITMMSNDFYMYYFVFTMVHAAHVLGGCAILALLWRKTRAGRYRRDMTGLETGASYWHLVDLIWLLMFPLLYLLR